MGYNLTVVVMYDNLEAIEADPKFGESLARACRDRHSNFGGKSISVSAGKHQNAARVIESHREDQTSIVAVGGNAASVVGHCYSLVQSDEDRVSILKALANQLGYTIHKKPSRNEPQ